MFVGSVDQRFQEREVSNGHPVEQKSKLTSLPSVSGACLGLMMRN